MFDTIKNLESTGEKWEHYFWTNDKKAIPESVKWMEEHGFIIREVKELKNFDSTWSAILDNYLVDN